MWHEWCCLIREWIHKGPVYLHSSNRLIYLQTTQSSILLLSTCIKIPNAGLWLPLRSMGRDICHQVTVRPVLPILLLPSHEGQCGKSLGQPIKTALPLVLGLDFRLKVGLLLKTMESLELQLDQRWKVNAKRLDWLENKMTFGSPFCALPSFQLELLAFSLSTQALTLNLTEAEPMFFQRKMLELD